MTKSLNDLTLEKVREILSKGKTQPLFNRQKSQPANSLFNRQALDLAIKIKQSQPVRIIPTHLMPFWRLYNKLLQEGWFDRMVELLKKEEPRIGRVMVDYGTRLASLVQSEQSIQKKYDYWQALDKFVDYVSGDLGK